MVSTKTTKGSQGLRSRFPHLSKVNLIEVLDSTEDLGARVVGQAVHWRREFYLPLKHGELRQRLADDPQLSADDRRNFLQLCQILSATFHYEYHERAERLKGDYEPFDPDAITRRAVGETEWSEEQAERVAQLFENLLDLLARANYHKLSQSQIEQAVHAASDWGVKLDVDFQNFERLEVYARGDVIGRRTRHRWQRLFQPEEVEVPIYQRVVVVFQLRKGRCVDRRLDTDAIYIKLFKNIPKEDVDMMLPGATARFSLLDRSKIVMPMVAMTAWRMLTVGLIATIAGFWGIVALAIFFGSNGIRSLIGYLNTKNKYQLNLTRSLYFQNLDNSSGVLLRLTDEAEEQEFHEAVMAYYLLWREAGESGWTEKELDVAAEAYLQQLCGYGVDFEVDDAVRKLHRLGLAVRAGEDRWKAVPIQDAIAALDRAWDAYFSAPSREGR
jgi:hypothetical protein